MAKTRPETNVDSNLWAAAMRAYEEDKGLVDRAQGQLRRHQLAFEKQGIPAATIRSRYKERDMSDDERQQLYAEEVISRRALNLSVWTAEDAEDFDVLMERAAATQVADAEELDGLHGARAYNDGFNGGAHGGLTVDDNPHVPGSVTHQQWSRGCIDGIDYADNIGNNPSQREEPLPDTVDALAPNLGKKPRGRPKKATAEPDAPVADPRTGSDADPETEGLFDTISAPMPV